MKIGATRTKKTDADYDRRARQIIARLDRDLLAIEHRRSRPEDLPPHLASLAGTLAHSSWRQYKAALVEFARTRAEEDANWQRVHEALTALRWSSASVDSATIRPKRTSARKLKTPKAERLEQLRVHLALAHPMAADFLAATWLCGLRPVEWAGASLEAVGDRWRLRICNAKCTNRRSHGEFRTLWFDSINFQQIMAVRRTISAFEKAAACDALGAQQERIERAFRTANNALWPRRNKSITPYTLRHVFAASAKLAYPSGEVAALMGHANDVTAYHHYGRQSRKRSGQVGPPLPAPDPEDVARVQLMRTAGLEKLAGVRNWKLSAIASDDVFVGDQSSDDEPSLGRL
jgi:integrase